MRVRLLSVIWDHVSITEFEHPYIYTYIYQQLSQISIDMTKHWARFARQLLIFYTIMCAAKQGLNCNQAHPSLAYPC